MKFFVAFLLVLTIASQKFSNAKVFSKCELARELYRAGFPFVMEKLPDWVCLVKFESSFNSSAVGGPNTNGSFDWGLFQINDRYWCGVGHIAGDCKIDCNTLITNDITDDIACSKIIYARHNFTAWNAWKSKCQEPLDDIHKVDECFP